MKDYQASLEKLLADAAEAKLICDLADPKKREVFVSVGQWRLPKGATIMQDPELLNIQRPR